MNVILSIHTGVKLACTSAAYISTYQIVELAALMVLEAVGYSSTSVTKSRGSCVCPALWPSWSLPHTCLPQTPLSQHWCVTPAVGLVHDSVLHVPFVSAK